MSEIFISCTNEMAIITLNNIPNDMLYLSKIFNIVAKNNINIDMITKTSVYKNKISLFFSICERDIELLPEAIKELKKLVPDILTEITGNFSKVSATNIFTKNRCDMLASFIKEASKLDINIFSISTAENEISALVSSENVNKFTEKLKASLSL